MPELRTYITRDGVEYEVTAELYYGGEYTLDEDETGTDLVVEQDPQFHEIFCEDPETGCELELTEAEFEKINEQLVAQYWKGKF